MTSQKVDPSPWHPEADPQRLKVLGKLAEEANELGAALARCIIQGIDEREPVTGKLNREWLEDEIADVIANCQITVQHFGLNDVAIFGRAQRKKDYIQRWLDGLTRPADPQPSAMCKRAEGCVCGGDTPGVRAGCQHWSGS